MSYNEIFFKKAFELAESGRGLTSPNPFVGAVLVRNNKIIGKGFTQPWGKDHAEIQAIKDANYDCRGAELYVTLEPCAHFGKTPPCADAIIKYGIKAVYAGIKDPNPKVNGKGFEKLESAGINVKKNIWKDKIERQLEYYLTFITKKRPFVFSKIATSFDGKISTASGKSKWITNDKSREFVHKLRAEADVIITGINTIIADDPMLNVRFGENKSHPTRIILDSNLRLPLDSKVVKSAKEVPTIVFTSGNINFSNKLKLESLGVIIEEIPLTNDKLDLKFIIDYIYNRNNYAIMIEAGNKINSSFISDGLIDKIYHFAAPKILGGNNSLFKDFKIDEISESVSLKDLNISHFEEDMLFQYYLDYKR